MYEPHESRAYLKRAVRESVEILRGDGLLVMFPEAYPNIDPGYTPKTEDDDSLPFKRGFATIARIAERRLGKQGSIIPVGLGYKTRSPDRSLSASASRSTSMNSVGGRTCTQRQAFGLHAHLPESRGDSSGSPA
ncbi:MAG: hypothetical protein R3A46_11855 [Thermomicrobiales bacterium]